MWVERPDGTDVTEDYYGIGSLGTRYFYYFDDAFKASETGKNGLLGSERTLQWHGPGLWRVLVALTSRLLHKQ